MEHIIKHRKRPAQTAGKLVFYKHAKKFTGEWKIFSTSHALTVENHKQRNEPQSIPCTILKKLTQNESQTCKQTQILKVPEVNTRENFCDHWLRKDFLDTTPEAQSIK